MYLMGHGHDILCHATILITGARSEYSSLAREKPLLNSMLKLGSFIYFILHTSLKMVVKICAQIIVVQ